MNSYGQFAPVAPNPMKLHGIHAVLEYVYIVLCGFLGGAKELGEALKTKASIATTSLLPNVMC